MSIEIHSIRPALQRSTMYVDAGLLGIKSAINVCK